MHVYMCTQYIHNVYKLKPIGAVCVGIVGYWTSLYYMYM